MNYRAGRAVSQLAGLLGPAGFSLRFKALGLAFGHCYPSLSQARCARFLDQ